VTHSFSSHPSEALDQQMFDASRFPLVRVRRRAVRSGYAFAWCAQMRRLLALNAPFVLVAEHCDEETAEDARLRSVWMRSQRHSLTAWCRGYVVVEPRIEARAGTREALRAATLGSGLRTVVVSSVRVAGELVPVLLAAKVDVDDPRAGRRSVSLPQGGKRGG
jgi:hypothetical protein